MTQVITRHFDSADKLHDTLYELVQINRLPRRDVRIFDKTDGLAEALAAEGVLTDSAKAYHDKLAATGGAVLVVRAGYKPLGVARLTRELTAQFGATDMGAVVEEVSVKEKPRLGISVFESHPYMMSVPRAPGSTNYHMANWPIPLISRRKPAMHSILTGAPKITAALYPTKLPFPYEPFTASIFPRHGRMANFPIGLISHRKPKDRFAFRRHARMANFPLPLLWRRKPRDRFAIPRHGRMANVPFPLLINGQTGTNALMPGGPRMANFPIRLISRRKPKDRFAFPRHARMARFPIPLISRRKPRDRFAIPRHGRMANFILPLVLRQGDLAQGQSGRGFSFSKLLRMPTLIRR